MKITILSLAAAVGFLLPALASADTFDWGFISSANGIDGWGTMTAVLSSTPGEYFITGGSGTIVDLGVAYAVTIVPCPSQPSTCTDSGPGPGNTGTDGGHGLDLIYDDLLFPNNAPADQLDGNGVVLAPGPQGTSGINLWGGAEGGGSPTFIFGYGSYGTPPNVTPGYTDGSGGLDLPFSITPESNSFTLLGLGLATLAFVRSRKKKQTT